jgi:branched-chain amino acid transport system substrate-binding protein
VKTLVEECETGYATDRGVECYERLKGKHGGATVFQPLSTGITFALTEKAPADKIPLITAGYGRSESTDGMRLQVELPAHRHLLGGRRHPAAAHRQEGRRLGQAQGQEDRLVYHDSPFGKEPIPLLQERSKMHGFDLQLLPVRTRAWSRRRPGCRSASSGPTTCCCGAGA